MTHHVQRAHTPEEMRRFSNVGHWIEGAIISGAGGLLLWEAFSGERRAERLASNLLTGAGLLLGIGLVAGSLEHGGPVTFFRADHQQREHLQMSGLLTAGGLARRGGRVGRLASAGATARIGQMFLRHEQHGTGEAAVQAKGRHERLGKTILAGAAAGAIGEALGNKWLRAAAAGLLALSGLQLLAYREPEGAYEEMPRSTTH
jgi:hypothetical protein